MLISGRRLKWGMLTLLVAAALCLFPPLQSQLNRWVVSWWDSRLELEEWRFHRQHALVEARGVSWHGERMGNGFGIQAERAWFAIAPSQLLDRQVVIPRARVDAAQLFLSDDALVDHPVGNVWDAELANHTGAIDWDAVHRQFRKDLAAQDSYATWKDRIGGWVTQSEGIQERLQVLMEQSDDGDNPLRLEEALRDKLSQVEQLQVEHQQLMRQLENVNTLVSSKCHQLRETFEARTQQMTSELILGQEVQASHGRIVESLVLEVLSHGWQQLASRAAVADLVALDFGPASISPGAGRDVRVGQASSFQFCVDELSMEGLFQHAGEKVPFALHAEMDYGDQGRQLSAAWDYQFKESTGSTLVYLQQQDRRLATIYASLCGPPAHTAASPSDHRLVAFSTDPTPSPTGQHSPRTTTTDGPVWAWLDVQRTASGFNGELSVDIAAAVGQSELCTHLLQAAQEKALGEETEIATDFRARVQGHWIAPTFEITGSTPQWLASTVGTQFTAALASATDKQRARVRDELNVELSDLRSLVQLTSRQARAIVSSHGQQLDTAQKVLAKRLDDMNGNAFANHYEQAVKMR